MNEQNFIQLHNHIVGNYAPGECDGTLSKSIDFAISRGWDTRKLTEFLESNGGYCDCEVIINVTRYVQDGTAKGLEQ